MDFDAIDGCPVPRRLAPAVRQVKARTGLALSSCYRGDDPNGVAILRRFGKRNQRELFDGFRRGLPGFNPANPPGRSTHELRNDGVAYRQWIPGFALPFWAVGQDWTSGAGAARAYNDLGYLAAVTYPGNPREAQHVNLRRKPLISKWLRSPLKLGSQGKRVGFLRYALERIHDPDTHAPYLERKPDLTRRQRRHMGAELVEAVKRFQRDHDQKADGVVGPQTHHQLMVSYRFWQKRHKETAHA